MSEGGEGGGGGEEHATLKIFPLDINNQNKTLHYVRHTFEEFICLKQIGKKTSIFVDISISVGALIEKFAKMTKENQL